MTTLIEHTNAQAPACAGGKGSMTKGHQQRIVYW